MGFLVLSRIQTHVDYYNSAELNKNRTNSERTTKKIYNNKHNGNICIQKSYPDRTKLGYSV